MLDDATIERSIEGDVTHLRHSSGKMSGSRNAAKQAAAAKYLEGTMGWLHGQPQSGDVCYYCRERFKPGQMRYRIMHDLPGSWGPALLCMDCFKPRRTKAVSAMALGGTTRNAPVAASTSTPFATPAT